MKRLSFKVPGFDCAVKCPHRPPCKPGRFPWRPAEWWYVVTDDAGEAALSFGICSTERPPGRADDAFTVPYAIDMAVHLAFRTDPEDRERTDCEFLPGGRCYGAHHSSLWAEEFVDARGGWKAFETYEQGSEFWSALEEELLDRLPDYRAQRLAPGLEHIDCPRCHGSGRVEQRSVEAK